MPYIISLASTMTLESKVRAYLRSLQEMDQPETKQGIRRTLWQRKRESLIERYEALKSAELAAISLMERVDYADIMPTMAWVSPDDRHIWNYLRHCVSSAPWVDRPGRELRLFCVDRRSGGVLGIADLGSDLQSIGLRDQYIGWSHERKLKGGGLRHIANLGTCVGVAPFGWLTGGKFIAVAATCREVADVWQNRYGDQLAAICTTSLFGKSSQYNRLKEYEYLGTTGGGGTSHVDQAGFRLLKEFVDKNNLRVAAGATPGGSRMMGGVSRQGALILACRALDLDFDDFPSAQPRGVYFAPLGENALAFLRGDVDEFSPKLRSWDEVAEWWHKRWYTMRWPKKRDLIEDFDFACYRLDAQIELCGGHGKTYAERAEEATR